MAADAQYTLDAADEIAGPFAPSTRAVVCISGTWTGQLDLQANTGEGWITIRSFTDNPDPAGVVVDMRRSIRVYATALSAGEAVVTLFEANDEP